MIVINSSLGAKITHTAGALFLALLLTGTAAAQQGGPLSPPDHPPVPLTDADQEHGRLATQPTPAMATSATAKPIVIPPTIPGRHLTTGDPEIDGLVFLAARRYRLDPCLIVAVMMAESSYNRRAISPRGACGLMQLMPATAVRFGVKDIFDAQENVMAGAGYLRWLLDRFGGDVRLALAGYNAGEGAVELYGNRIPPYPETQSYVKLIYANYSKVHPLTNGQPGEVPAGAVPPQTAAGPVVNPTYNQIVCDAAADSGPASISHPTNPGTSPGKQ